MSADDQPYIVNLPLGFVDRGPELALFRGMLAGRVQQRVLCLLAEREQGKTFLLLRLFHECEARDLPVVRLDFDERRSGLTDYLGVAREVRRQLGDERTGAICACEADIAARPPLVQIQTGSGGGSVDLGLDARDSQVTVGDVTAGDHIDMRGATLAERPPTAAELARQRDDMGRALARDLAALAQVVLLVDTFERAGPETCRWLERWLFEPLRRSLPGILVVVAGRPECREFFGRPSLWQGLVRAVDRFDPLGDDDILAHYRLREIPYTAEEIPLLLDLARPGPAEMARIGDRLRQTRGGAR